MATVIAQSNPKSRTDGTALELIIKNPPTKAIVVENRAFPVYSMALFIRASGVPCMSLLLLYL